MINHVRIKNFKSIKYLELDCKRVNIFIGEPNSGKSNIIEGLVGLISAHYYLNYYPYSKLEYCNRFVRHEDLSNLFYDNNIHEKIEISYDSDLTINIYYDSNSYKININKEIDCGLFYFLKENYKDHDNILSILSKFKFYRFLNINEFKIYPKEFLLPPDGRNLASVIGCYRNLKQLIKDILDNYGLKMMIDKEEIKLVKDDDVIVVYPYSVLSDGLKRVIFYYSSILTNKNSIIALEEPETHVFPYYTKQLAETIGLYKSNQYFITTHNPYFLLSLIEKTNIKDLGVFLVYYDDYSTKIKELTENEIRKLVDNEIDIFFNIDELISDKL